MNLSYAWEKFAAAIGMMATSHGSLQFRIAAVWQWHLGRLRPVDLPPDLRDEFETLTRLVSWRPAVPGDGAVGATCRQMADDEAADVAQRIYALHGRVASGKRELDDRELWEQGFKAANVPRPGGTEA